MTTATTPPDPRLNTRAGAPEPPASAPARSLVTGWPIAATLAVVAVILYIIRYALIPFVFAAAIAFVVEPVVVALQGRLGSRRWVAAVLIYLIVLSMIGSAAYWIGSTAFADLLQFLQRLPEIARQLLTQLIGPQVALLGHTYTPQEIVQLLAAALTGALGLGAAAKAAGIGFAVIFGGFLMLVLIIYMMVSGPRLVSGAIWLIPPERRPSLEVLLPKIVPALRRYLVGILTVVAYTATVAWIGFGPVFHLPHAVLLAITVGVLELIPAVGPFASATLVGLTAFQLKSLTSVLALIGFAIALRLTIDNLIGPLVLGQAARLHPVIIIFAFVCGAMLFGVIGLLLAIPVAVCIRIVLQHYYAEPIREAPPP